MAQGSQTIPVREEDPDRQAELRWMKFRATGLFAAVTLVFASTFLVDSSSTWAGIVRATSEAAMVGALADWFAVTALFRHPLGLKIPHTAIIPRRKDQFGERLGGFIQDNFLSDEVVARRIRTMNIARRSAAWISRPDNSEGIAHLATAGIGGIIRIVDDEDVQHLIEREIVARIQSARAAPLAGKLLSLAAADHKQQDLLIGILRVVEHLVAENEDTIRKKIVDETPWWLPWPIDEPVYQRIVGSLERLLHEMYTNPKHPLHEKFREMFHRFVDDLQHAPDVIARGEAIKAELLDHPVVQEFSSALWTDMKASAIRHAANPDSTMHQSIQRAVTQFGALLTRDEGMQQKINRWLEDGARYLIREYGHEVGLLIAQTVRGWDAGVTSRKIELQIGKDLQFIRINGTIVGGLAGLAIHLISWLL